MTDIGTYIDSIARRVRDSSNTGHTRAFVQDIFTRCTSLTNSRQEYVFDTVTLSAGTAGKALYNVENELGGMSLVTEVEIDGESLNQVEPWKNLWKLSPNWLTDTSNIPVAWAAVGRDLVAIYPAPVSDISVAFTGVRGDFQALAETEETGLRDEDADIVKELTVALLLLRQRDLDMINMVVSRFSGKVNIQSKEIEELMRIG